MKKILTSTCYLCAKPLTPPTNADHPIMQQLFAPEIRRKYNISQLLTLDVHKACNTAYKRDEDYFVRTLMPFARGSEAGNAIYQKVLDDYRAGKEALLTRKVLREFDPQPHGLVLPGGKVVKRFEGERLRRVVWKMVRGLHFHHSGGEVLPERWSSVGVKIFGPDDQPTEDVVVFAGSTSRGIYPGVFEYKFDKFVELRNLHYWLLLLWDRLMFRVAFHDPGCPCETCEGDRRARSLTVKRTSASRPSGEWNDDDFDMLAHGAVVGRIMKVHAAPIGSPWMRTLAFGQHEDRTPTHGYEPTREAAMAAFAKSWRRE